MLAFMYVGDNGLPPNADEVEAYWQELGARFPRAVVGSGSLDGFAHYVTSHHMWRDLLPLVTADIGDSWLYGVAADPVKLSGTSPHLLVSSRFSVHGMNRVVGRSVSSPPSTYHLCIFYLPTPPPPPKLVRVL